MYYRRIIPWLLLSACLAGCNARSDPDALQHPIHQRIINAQLVTLEIISVNGLSIPRSSQSKAINTFRQYVAGDVHVVQGKPVSVKLDKDGKIAWKQIDEILKVRQHKGASDIAILYIPEVAWKTDWAAMYCHNSNGREYRQFILYQSTYIQQMSKKFPLSEETCHHLLLLHELCHSFWVPCDRKRSWYKRHCTHSDCIIYPGVDLRSFGTFLLRGKPPTDLCPACQAEIRQAQLAAGGKLIPPNEPYDFLTYCDDLVRLNPDNPGAYQLRFKYHNVCKRYGPMIADLTRLIELEPRKLQNRMDRAAAYQLTGDTEAAQKDLADIIDFIKTNPYSLNSLAWVLAASPVECYRNGRIAVEVATKACTLDEWKCAAYVDTLAAAYAENGQFDKAMEFQTQAIRKDQKKQYEKGFQERLELYRQKKPYRIPPPE